MTRAGRKLQKNLLRIFLQRSPCLGSMSAVRKTSKVSLHRVSGLDGRAGASVAQSLQESGGLSESIGGGRRSKQHSCLSVLAQSSRNLGPHEAGLWSRSEEREGRDEAPFRLACTVDVVRREQALDLVEIRDLRELSLRPTLDELCVASRRFPAPACVL